VKLTADQFAIIAAGVLFLIIATGSARIMLAVSGIGLLLGLSYLRKDSKQSSAIAINIAFFLVMIIAIVIWLKK
jgi:hypothetical protein